LKPRAGRGGVRPAEAAGGARIAAGSDFVERPDPLPGCRRRHRWTRRDSPDGWAADQPDARRGAGDLHAAAAYVTAERDLGSSRLVLADFVVRRIYDRSATDLTTTVLDMVVGGVTVCTQLSTGTLR
jgi:hypothetical protein